jgi:hypothetical protein
VEAAFTYVLCPREGVIAPIIARHWIECIPGRAASDMSPELPSDTKLLNNSHLGEASRIGARPEGTVPCRSTDDVQVIYRSTGRR